MKEFYPEAGDLGFDITYDTIDYEKTNFPQWHMARVGIQTSIELDSDICVYGMNGLPYD